MLSFQELVVKSQYRINPYPFWVIDADRELTDRLTVCIPDVHLLERGPTDDFLDRNLEHEQRFLRCLNFLYELKNAQREDLEIVQVGDLYDLWQARGNTNLIQEKYTEILGLLNELGTIYLVGNHDFDLVKWYEDQKETFGRKWRHFSTVEGKPRVLYEHGYQADFWNNKEKWSGTIGEEITKILGMAEYLYPDVDVDLGKLWDGVNRAFTVYNSGLTPRKNPDGFSVHEYTNYYMDRMEQYNSGDTTDIHGPADLALAVVGHTHSPRLVRKPKDGRIYYLMDCGSWVNGRHDLGVIAGRTMALCQWA